MIGAFPPAHRFDRQRQSEGAVTEIRWAERLPVGASGGVEVRPVIDYSMFETAGEDAAARA